MSTIRIEQRKLEFAKKQTVSLHEDSDILAVKVHDNDPYIYALVESDNDVNVLKYDVYFFEVGTHIDPEVASSMDYIDTIEDYRGIVFHVFGCWNNAEN